MYDRDNERKVKCLTFKVKVTQLFQISFDKNQIQTWFAYFQDVFISKKSNMSVFDWDKERKLWIVWKKFKTKGHNSVNNYPTRTI